MSDIPQLPATFNGYPVVAQCLHCSRELTVMPDYKGVPRLVHAASLKRSCPILLYATADRPVPELGLLDESNRGGTP
jgi:hypothetical protein